MKTKLLMIAAELETTRKEYSECQRADRTNYGTLLELIGNWATSLREIAEKGDSALKDARAANERDRSIVAGAVSAVRAVIRSYGWATVSRGAYHYDDDEYRMEFGRCLDAIEGALIPLNSVAKDFSNCPDTQAEIELARAKPAPTRGGEIMNNVLKIAEEMELQIAGTYEALAVLVKRWATHLKVIATESAQEECTRCKELTAQSEHYEDLLREREDNPCKGGLLMAQVEKLPAEIADAARVTALRSLHELTCVIEQQRGQGLQPDLPLLTALREVVATLEMLGPISTEAILVEKL